MEQQVCLNGALVREVVNDLRLRAREMDPHGIADRLEHGLVDVPVDALLLLAHDAMSLEQLRAVRQVLAERAEQDAQWGGSAHDDAHLCDDWLRFINMQVNKARLEAVDGDGQPARFGSFFVPVLLRQRLAKVAALAIAAMESLDRRGLAR